MFPAAIADTLTGPSWLTELRAAAAARAEAEPLPSFEAEEWRYSPIAELTPDRFTLASDGVGGDQIIPWHAGSDHATVTVHTVDGRLVDMVGDLPIPGLTIAEASEFDTPVRFGEGPDVFSRTNLAFAPAPIVVRLADDIECDVTIHLAHSVAAGDAVVLPRVRIETGTHATCTVMETFSSADVSSLVLSATEIVVGPGGRVRYQQMQDLGDAMWQIGSLEVDVDRDATFEGALAGLGGGYARVRTDCRLHGRGGTADLLAVYYGDGDQTLDYRTFQHHLGRDTTSSLLFKGVLDDSSTAIYTGLIKVDETGRGTNAVQTNRIVKLSDEAWAESVPNLEIETDDVRCSHASTVSPIDGEQRFYLESRGIPSDVVERLVVDGFLAEVVEALPVPAARDLVRKGIVAKLARRAEREEQR